MRFYRLVKPIWGQKQLRNGKDNPKFEKEIYGKNTYEGANFTEEFLQEKNSQGYNIYFFPNHPSTDVYKEGVKSLSGKHIDVFNNVYVDMDLKDEVYESKEAFIEKLSQFPLTPNEIVDSGNGIHAYWKVKDLDRNSFCLMQMALLKYFNTDESVWTVLQLMRVPGYYNTKVSNNYVKATSIKPTDKEYSLADFPNELLNLPEETIQKVRKHLDRLDGKLVVDFSKDINLNELPEKFQDLLDKNDKIRQMFNDPKSLGDRSKVDYTLAHMLYTEGYNVNETLAVIANTQKALEKGASRLDYAKVTVEKIFESRPKHKFKTVTEMLKDQKSTILAPLVTGPHYLDHGVLGMPWRKKELLGLIAGSGVGKTSFSLNIVEQTIKNNPGNDDVYVFFSLEMTKGQIIKRWVDLVGENSPLTDRLYVIDREGPDGTPLNIGLQEIYEFCTEIKQCTGKELGCIIVDHFHIVSTHIDVKKSPNFGIGTEGDTGYGSIQNLTLQNLASQFKSLVQTLNTFGVLLSQTTKEKGVGDLPLGKDAAHGVSHYEWIMDRIITIWQPLMRVHSQTNLRLLAFQYAKIREKHVNDKIQELSPKLLTYNTESGKLVTTNEMEYQDFMKLKPLADEARDAAVKKKASTYSIHVDMDDLMSRVSQNRG